MLNQINLQREHRDFRSLAEAEVDPRFPHHHPTPSRTCINSRPIQVLTTGEWNPDKYLLSHCCHNSQTTKNLSKVTSDTSLVRVLQKAVRKKNGTRLKCPLAWTLLARQQNSIISGLFESARAAKGTKSSVASELRQAANRQWNDRLDADAISRSLAVVFNQMFSVFSYR